MSQDGSTSTIVRLAVILFIGAIVLAKIEPMMTAMKTSAVSANANTTIDAVASNAWSGMQLTVVALVIVGAAIILRYTNLI